MTFICASVAAFFLRTNSLQHHVVILENKFEAAIFSK